VAQNTNKEKNNKLLLILSIISIVLVIISITVNILWFQFLYERSLIVQRNVLDMHTKFDDQFHPEYTK
jgi:hypothetical protein